MSSSLQSGCPVYEPTVDGAGFYGAMVIADLDEFKARADVIVANLRAPELDDVATKIYTRDIYGTD